MGNFNTGRIIECGYSYTSTVVYTARDGDFVNYRFSGTSVVPRDLKTKGVPAQSIAGGQIGTGNLPDGSPGKIITNGPSGYFDPLTSVQIFYGVEVGIAPGVNPPESYAVIHPLGSVTIYPNAAYSPIFTEVEASFTVRLKMPLLLGVVDSQQQAEYQFIWPDAGLCYREIEVSGTVYRTPISYTPGTQAFPSNFFGQVGMEAVVNHYRRFVGPGYEDRDFSAFALTSYGIPGIPEFVYSGSQIHDTSVSTGSSNGTGKYSIYVAAGNTNLSYFPVGTYTVKAYNKNCVTGENVTKLTKISHSGGTYNFNSAYGEYSKTYGGVIGTSTVEQRDSGGRISGSHTESVNTLTIPPGTSPILTLSVSPQSGSAEAGHISHFTRIQDPAYSVMRMQQREEVELLTVDGQIVDENPNTAIPTPTTSPVVSSGTTVWSAGKTWQIGYRFLDFYLKSSGSGRVTIEGELISGSVTSLTVDVTSTTPVKSQLDLLETPQSGLGDWLSLRNVKVTWVSGDPVTITGVRLSRKWNSRLTCLNDARWGTTDANPVYGDYPDNGVGGTRMHEWSVIYGYTDGVRSFKVLNYDSLGYLHAFSIRNLIRHINNDAFYSSPYGTVPNYLGSSRGYYPRTWGWYATDLSSPTTKDVRGLAYYPIAWWGDSDVRLAALNGDGYAGNHTMVNYDSPGAVTLLAQRTSDRLIVPWRIAKELGGVFEFYGLHQGGLLGSLVTPNSSGLQVHETFENGSPVDNALPRLYRNLDASTLSAPVYGALSNTKANHPIINAVENPGGTPTHYEFAPEMRQLNYKRFWPVESQNVEAIASVLDSTQKITTAYIAVGGDIRAIKVHQIKSGQVGSLPHIGNSRDVLVASGVYSTLSLFEIAGTFGNSASGDQRHGHNFYGLVSIVDATDIPKLFLSYDGETWKNMTIPGTYTAQVTLEHFGRIIFFGWRSNSWYVRVGSAKAFTGTGSTEYTFSAEHSIVSTTNSAGSAFVRESGTLTFTYIDSSGHPQLLQTEALGNNGVGTWV